MRIDPNGLIGGCPALVVRKALRHLRVWDQWGVADLEAVAALAPGTGDALVKAWRTEGLIEASARGAWSVTQGGTHLLGCIGSQAGHTGDRGESAGRVS